MLTGLDPQEVQFQLTINPTNCLWFTKALNVKLAQQNAIKISDNFRRR
jgi:hypothetical protein